MRLLLGSSGTSDNLNQLASNDGLTGSVEENLVTVDHVSSVLGSVLKKSKSQRYGFYGIKGGFRWLLTSIAFLRADCSQA